MPDGFGFPFDHQFWIPFRADPLAYERFDGPTIYVFGRLRQASRWRRRRRSWRRSRRRRWLIAPSPEPLRAAVVPYTHDHVDLAQPGMVLLVRRPGSDRRLAFVVAINLAILFYARTVTRSGELAVRTALGASRGRLLTQLFLEALSLALVGAALRPRRSRRWRCATCSRSRDRPAACRTGFVSTSRRRQRSRAGAGGRGGAHHGRAARAEGDRPRMNARCMS